MAAPRSSHATTPTQAAAAARRRTALPNGVLGVILFIATEGAFFGTLIASYFYLRFNATRWPPAGIERPALALPVVLAAVIVATAVPMHLATRAAAAGRRGLTAALVGGALLVQGGYLAIQIVSYLHDLDSFGPKDGAYGSIYFTLLGADHGHVAVGLLLSLWLLARLASGLTSYRVKAVRVVAWYWYFVAGVAIAVTATQVSAA